MTAVPPTAALALAPPANDSVLVGLDHARLREQGIGDLIAMANANWTDFNSHDPGVTALEALCYALTELAHRATLPIEDILASLPSSGSASDPVADQAFFTARTILTVNPVTPDDIRRVLIDIVGVRNAWVRCRSCACEAAYYAWCEDGELRLSHDPSECTAPGATPKRVSPRGLYDISVVLESDPELGDLNDRKIELRETVIDEDGVGHALGIELRVPAVPVGGIDHLARPADEVRSIRVGRLRRSATANAELDDDGLRRGWNGTFVVDLAVELVDRHVTVEGISMRLFGSNATRSTATVDELRAVLDAATSTSIAERHRRKAELAANAIRLARHTFNRHRNLDEDICHIDTVAIEDVAVCARVDVDPLADIEEVQAKVWFTIEQHLDPPIPFRTLGELQAKGVAVEEIFNGPELDNGFLTAADLTAASARTVVRVSDLVNALMDIEGVLAVEEVLLTGYDAAGEPVAGTADPDWDETDGTKRYDPSKVSAAWELAMLPGHQPRLYRRMSRFAFTKDGLPFTPREDEVADLVTQLWGAVASPKIVAAGLDLPVPRGTARPLDDCFPVQYSFPLAYGVGPFGLPDSAPPRRHAQATQLKGYLMVFEQLLRDRCAQLAHVAELFSLDPDVDRTTFSSLPDATTIQGYAQLVPGLTAKGLQDLVESPDQFADRRNRFLDHLLARFGEQFDEHALLLADRSGRQRAGAALIGDKIDLLRAYPVLSHDRARAFDRRVAPCAAGNTSGLERRIRLLLGSPDHRFEWEATSTPGEGTTQRLLVVRQDGAPLFDLGPVADVDLDGLEDLVDAVAHPAATDAWRVVDHQGQLRAIVTHADRADDEQVLYQPEATAIVALLVHRQREVLRLLGQRDRFSNVPADGEVRLQLDLGDGIGKASATSATPADAAALRDELISWSALVRAIVVEHLLLRPKFPGDALLPVCCDGACGLCGAEDPYSFRITVALPGWIEPFATDLELRRFAERTIRRETPSHLLVKVCWVGNDGVELDECAPILDEVARLLAGRARTAGGEGLTEEQACACATVILHAIDEAFQDWYDDHRHEHLRPGSVVEALADTFMRVDLSALVCAADLTADTNPDLVADLHAMLVDHFATIAVDGFQFDRFEDAWCRWLDVDAAIDWTAEQLLPYVEAVLAEPAADGAGSTDEQRCVCAADLLASVGTKFASWVDDLAAGSASIDPAHPFEVGELADCEGIEPGESVRTALRDRYRDLGEVSLALRIVGERLGSLRDTYPAGTLHDCDDAGDHNPIRLGQTALGSNFHDH